MRWGDCLAHRLLARWPAIDSRRIPIAKDLLALVAGTLLPLGFAPVSWYPLAILLPAVLLWLWEGESPGRAAWRGGLFGLGLFGVGISWVYISLHQFGNAHAAFAALTTLLLILLMALYPAAVGYLLARWAPGPAPIRWLLIAPALWGLWEWVRSWLFTGFPWLSLGYSQIDAPLAGFAPYLGVFGVSWAVWLSAGLLLLLIHGSWRARLIWGSLMVALWIGAWGLGQSQWITPVGDPVKVALVQGNIGQERKWQPEQLGRTLRTYVELSQQATGNDLIIWPETAIPLFYEDVEEDFIPFLKEQVRRTNTDYLIGIPAGSLDTGIFYNAVVGLSSDQGFYYKRRLVPFGEYLPLRSLLSFFHSWVDIPMADFASGADEQPPLKVGGYPVGVSICFEVAFGSEIRKSLPEVQLLVNVSNDAWFGDSLAPHQHLEIARMRALEAGRPMARATNTGISALIDVQGQIVAHSQQFVPEVLEGSIQPMRGATPYVRFGDMAAVLFLGLLLGLGLVLERLKLGRRSGLIRGESMQDEK